MELRRSISDTPLIFDDDDDDIESIGKIHLADRVVDEQVMLEPSQAIKFIPGNFGASDRIPYDALHEPPQWNTIGTELGAERGHTQAKQPDPDAPKLDEVYYLLGIKSKHWYNIGRELGVRYAERERLRCSTNPAKVKLRETLRKWMESACSPVTWDNLIKVLKKLKMYDVQKNVLVLLQDKRHPVHLGDGDNIQGDQKHFLQAMAECAEEITQLNIMLDGPPGVGKTSLFRIILGKDPLPKKRQNSTNIMKNPVRAITAKRLNKFKGRFEKLSDEEIIHVIAEFIKQINPPSDDSEDSDQDIPQDQQSIPANSTSIDALKAVKYALPSAQPSSRMFSSIWHHLIDSGGQPQFQDMLPLLFRSPSFQIVLMRLTEGLENKPKMCYTVKGESVVPPDDLHLTNLQYIERACQKATVADPPSKVMIVGTHKDKLKGDVTTTLASLEKGLAHLRKKYEQVLVVRTTTANGNAIFPMNTMARGEERKGYIKEIQDALTAVTDVLAKPQPIPLRWFVFQLALRSRASVIRMYDCLELGYLLGMEYDVVNEALIFFNQSALLLYYPDADRDLVLTKVDPIIERLSQLVATTFKVPHTLQASSHLCTRLKEKGLFDEAFCDQLFTEFSDGLSSQEFLKLLGSLRIAVLVDEKEQLYFLPSALSYLSSAESTASKDGLAFGFILKGRNQKVYTSDKEHILPLSFFFTSIVELLSNDKYPFKLHLNKQYRNQIQVMSPNIPGSVILSDKTWWMQITIASKIPSCCPIIFKAVKGAIDCTITRLKHTGIASYELVFPCPIDGHNNHYCTITTTPDNSMYYTCSSDGRTGLVTEDMKHWIKADEDQQSASQNVVPTCVTNGKGTLEYRVFTNCYSAILEAMVNPLTLADKLLPEGFISHSTHRDLLDQHIKEQQSRNIMRSVSVKIAQDTSNLYKFMRILEGDPLMDHVVSRMKQLLPKEMLNTTTVPHTTVAGRDEERLLLGRPREFNYKLHTRGSNG